MLRYLLCLLFLVSSIEAQSRSSGSSGSGRSSSYSGGSSRGSSSTSSGSSRPSSTPSGGSRSSTTSSGSKSSGGFNWKPAQQQSSQRSKDTYDKSNKLPVSRQYSNKENNTQSWPTSSSTPVPKRTFNEVRRSNIEPSRERDYTNPFDNFLTGYMFSQLTQQERTTFVHNHYDSLTSSQREEIYAKDPSLKTKVEDLQKSGVAKDPTYKMNEVQTSYSNHSIWNGFVWFLQWVGIMIALALFVGFILLMFAAYSSELRKTKSMEDTPIIEEDKYTEIKSFKLGDVVLLDLPEYNGVHCEVVGDIKWTLEGDSPYEFTDYVLVYGDNKNCRLRYLPDGRSLVFTQQESFAYDKNLHEILKDKSKDVLEIDGVSHIKIGEPGYSSRFKFVERFDENKSGKYAHSEIVKKEIDQWLYENKDSGELVSMEMFIDNGWMERWNGKEVNPQVVL